MEGTRFAGRRPFGFDGGARASRTRINSKAVCVALVRRKKSEQHETPTERRHDQAGRDMDEKRVREIIAAVKPLAVEYYRLTKKPPGVTGEIAELAAVPGLTGNGPEKVTSGPERE